MSIMSDMQYEVDSYIVKNGYCRADNTRKMRLVETGMKKYMIEKIGEIDSRIAIPENMEEEVSLHDLAEMLGSVLPTENRNKTMSNLTRYVIGVAGFMQGGFIKWDINDDPAFVTCPLVELNQDGKWDRLVTHEETPYLQAFDLALENLDQVMKLKNKRDKEFVKSMRQVS